MGAERRPVLERAGGAPGLLRPPLMLCEGCSGADTHGRSLAEERLFCAEVESAKGKAVKGRGVQGPWFCLQDHRLP